MNRFLILTLLVLAACDEPIDQYVARCMATDWNGYHLNYGQCVSTYRSGGFENGGSYTVGIYGF